MRAVDTNVLIRLITRDDGNQLRAAEQFVANGAWVSPLVLTERNDHLERLDQMLACE